MKHQSELRKARARIASVAGKSEFTAQEQDTSLKEILNDIQAVRKEMNQAKMDAMNEAAKPYLDTIAELELTYTMFLSLSS